MHETQLKEFSEVFHNDIASNAQALGMLREPLGAFLVNRESFMAFYNFERFIEVNVGA